MSAINADGVEYARLSETSEGDTLIADDVFACMAAGPHVVMSEAGLRHPDGLYVECSEGRHYLCTMGAAGEHIRGFTKPVAADDAPELTDSHLHGRWA